MVSEERVVYDSGSHMPNLARVCRELYKEVGLLPYSSNKFSFCCPKALNAWFNARTPAQRAVINTLWFDVEWAQKKPKKTTSLSSIVPGAVIKASWLAWSVVNDAYPAALKAAHGPLWHENHPYCDIDTNNEMDEKFEEFIEKGGRKGEVERQVSEHNAGGLWGKIRDARGHVHDWGPTGLDAGLEISDLDDSELDNERISLWVRADKRHGHLATNLVGMRRSDRLLY